MKKVTKVIVPVGAKEYVCETDNKTPTYRPTTESRELSKNEFILLNLENTNYIACDKIYLASSCELIEENVTDNNVMIPKILIKKGTPLLCMIHVSPYKFQEKNKIKKDTVKQFNVDDICHGSLIHYRQYRISIFDCVFFSEPKKAITTTKISDVGIKKKLIIGTKFKIKEDFSFKVADFERKTFSYVSDINKIRGTFKLDTLKENDFNVVAGDEYKIKDTRILYSTYMRLPKSSDNRFCYKCEDDGFLYDLSSVFLTEIENVKTGKITRVIHKSFDTSKIEILSVAESFTYVIKNKDGLYYGGPDYDNNYYKNGEVNPKFGYFSKAKKFKDISKLKASVMYFTGYTSFSESMENDGFGSKLYDLDPTWKVSKINKLTYEEAEEIDIYVWYQNLLRLRPLTEKYGSAVRSAYKEYEKGNITVPTCVVIKKPYDAYHGEYGKLDIKKYCSDYVKKFNCEESVAIITKDIKEACKMKLKGDGDITVINLCNLELEVKEPQ